MSEIERIKANRKRSKILSYLKKQNIMLASDIQKHISKYEMDNTSRDFAISLKHALLRCSNLSLYGDTGGDIRLISSLTCNHKLCNICNWNRQKKIRRKYFLWFGSNETINRVRFNGKTKHITNAQLNSYEKNGWVLVDNSIKYDLMHLTLTVPHTENGWRGKKVYFSEIMQSFNQMRKHKDWNSQVYGGEFGVETTKNKSGYHTHIHALLFVAKGKENRNRLHLTVLKLWNRLTVDVNANRTEFNDVQREAIKKGNKLVSSELFDELNPKGATLISCEMVYYKKGKEKIYYSEWGSEAMILGVLETISYHFKPKIFNMGDHSHDIATIVDMLPKVYKKVLYRKFGCLHGEKSLNVNDDSLLEDFEDVSEMIDTETGEVLQTQFFIANPIHVYPKGKDNEIALLQKARIEVLRAHSTKEAIQQTIEKSYKPN